jgi:arylsulfatase A-like enzyme
MSDHGTNLGEHPVKDIPWRKKGIKYPQHTTMYDHDLKVAMIIKGENLPKRKVIKDMVRSIDLVPTLLDLTGLSAKEYDFDGQSMLSIINKNETRDEVYSEDLFESRGEGALQSLRTKDFKFIRNLTLGKEECYDLNSDPQEQNNLLQKTDKEKLITIRKKMNVFLKTEVASGKEFSQKEKEDINQRLRGLGYIQ